MIKYEVMFIVKPTLEEAEIKKVAENFKKVLTDNGASVTNERSMGQRQFAYDIDNHKSGYYFVYNFESDTSKCVSEFDRLALISEDLIRHLIINLDK